LVASQGQAVAMLVQFQVHKAVSLVAHMEQGAATVVSQLERSVLLAVWDVEAAQAMARCLMSGRVRASIYKKQPINTSVKEEIST